MAYRSELAAALARLDATRAGRLHCPACEARATRHLRFARWVIDVFVAVGAFALVGIATLSAMLTVVLAGIGFLVAATAGDYGKGTAAFFLAALAFALTSYGGFRAFAYCDRRLTLRW